ncbi:MAG: hypothetical protein CL452_05855 [Acidimicrobiaceae bacterium]|nr:hypothetical protein [Acidimicrobiaceae bacterium]
MLAQALLKPEPTIKGRASLEGFGLSLIKNKIKTIIRRGKNRLATAPQGSVSFDVFSITI